jgi:Flagellar hook-length control protein FliK
MLGDGAFLLSLPFTLQSGLAAGQGPAAGVDAPPLASAATKGARLETSGASGGATVNQAKPAVARLTGERAFHLAPSASGAVSASPSPIAGATVIDAPSLAPALTAVENRNPAPRLSVLAPVSTQDRRLTHAAPPSPSSTAGVSPSSGEATPAVGTASAIRQPSAPVAPRGAGGSANPPVSPRPAAPQDLARGGRKVEAASSPSVSRAASPGAPSAKAEPVDKADARPPDPAALGAQPATQASIFGAPLLAPVARPSFGPYEAPEAADAVPGASAPTPAAPTPATAPIKEIDVDLSPGGLEDVSMTMRLSGDRLSVVIRAASSQTKGSIEGARNAIADRLAAIGQPLDSLIIRQTGVNADANANGNGASADDRSTSGGRPSGQGTGEQGGSGDESSSRRGAGRDRGF